MYALSGPAILLVTIIILTETFCMGARTIYTKYPKYTKYSKYGNNGML